MRTLDRFITIETMTTEADPTGEPVETWIAIDARRPAAYKPLNGTERFAADQFIARQQAEFIIRWSVNVSLVSPLDRIIYPAGGVVVVDDDDDDDGPQVFQSNVFQNDVFQVGGDSSESEPPRPEDIYDIMDVQELGRQEGLRILAARRSEAS